MTKAGLWLAGVRGKKRLFLGLLGGCLLAAGLLNSALWRILFEPVCHTGINHVPVLALAVFLSFILLMAGLGMAGILVALFSPWRPGFFQEPMRVAMIFFFPVIMELGKLLKIDTDQIRKSFVEVNNQMVRVRRFNLDPGQVLVLVPHCLQRTQCPHKITSDMDNCRRCGGCRIGQLLDIRDSYGVRMGVATGGTLARKYVRDYRPRAVVAVACERDLVSGIQDSTPLPVLGVTNERPFGPCSNTCIDPEKVEWAIKFFTGGEGGENNIVS
ncbi:MAG: DUF116 domain-containing protein [Bacillota bacterium]